MKTFKLLSVVCFLFLVSCDAVRVYCDYDKKVDFTQFKTFAFYKQGIDKVEISDLDKRRILHAIEDELLTKGFSKSDNPDLLVNIFTKSREQVDINQFNAGWGYGWGFGWNPWGFGGFGGQTTVATSTEGTLFIDLIDTKKKEMVWQGEGQGELTRNVDKKDEKIKAFVTKILTQYPPTKRQ